MTAPLTVADVLERAADLIEPEGAWTRAALARDAEGNIVDPFRSDAVCFCAIGAIDAVIGSFYGGEDARRILRDVVPFGQVGNFNDAPGRTQPEVVAKLREAATLARAQVQP